MFVDFDSVFRPTEEQRRQQTKWINDLIRKTLKEDGECCANCKHIEGVNVGHGWMEYRCKQTCEWIDEDIKCEHYAFCGFVEEMNGKSKRKRKNGQLPGQLSIFDTIKENNND